MDDKLNPQDGVSALLIKTAPPVTDSAHAAGVYHFDCYDADGNLLWHEDAPNTVTTEGMNFMLQTTFTGSAYTVTGPFMGLISSVSWSATASSDTMASHPGWTEAGSTNAPAYTVGGTANRASAPFGTAASGTISLSSSLTFTFTANGTVEGAFVVLGSGAVNTWGNTSGSLWSAAQFAGGAQTVSSGNQLVVSYSTSL